MIPRTLPFVRSNTAVRYFRHAISLDERRAKFTANHWNKLVDDDEKGTHPKEMPRSNQRHRYFDSDEKEHSRENNGPKTDVREVWFAGCHAGTCNRPEAAFPI